MNRKLKRTIKYAFDAPKATRKDEFLKSLCFPKSNYFDFICSQIGYIRKRVWVMSGILPLSILCGLRLLSSEEILSLIWLASSLLPFVALIAITEISRSAAYNMAELEISCKYSLSDIILVRMGVLGGFNIVVFTAILLLFIGKTDYGILRLGVYIFTPFMLSCTLSLAVLNHLKTRETAYVCGGISCFVSMLNSISFNLSQIAFADKYLFLWRVVFLLLLFGAVFQTVKLIKKPEELGWSLRLTD